MTEVRADSDASVRVVAFVAATLLHLPLFLASELRRRPPGGSDALLVRFIPASHPQRAVADDRDVGSADLVRNIDRPPAENVATIRERDRANIAPTQGSAVIPLSPEHARDPVDWELSGAIASQAAIDAIIREEAYRSLGPREKQHQIIEPPSPPSVFEQPKRRARDIAPNATGYDSVWHNEHCFTQLEQPIIPLLPRAAGEAGASVNPMKCFGTIGKREPRGDLFDHLKKERDKTLPAAK